MGMKMKLMQSQSKVPRMLRTRSAAIIGAGVGVVVMGFVYLIDDVGSDVHRVSGWVCSKLEPSTAHSVLLKSGAWGLLPMDYDKDDPYLVIEPCEGLLFRTPVGLPSGFQSDVCINALLRLGFGFVELGPCVDEHEAQRLERILATRDKRDGMERLGQIGVAVGGTDTRLIQGHVATLGPHVHYIALDLASIPEPARSIERLEPLLTAMAIEASKLPAQPKLFLRVSTSWLEKASAESLAPSLRNAGAVGLILTCEGDGDEGDCHTRLVKGLSAMYTADSSLILISCGGIASGRDALELVEAGATVVQLAPSLLFNLGPQACRRVKNELGKIIMEDSIFSLASVVGRQHRKSKRRLKNRWKGQGPSPPQ